METEKDFIIYKGDFYNSEKIRKIFSKNKPERIIFDLSDFESVYSSFLGLVVLIVKENEEQNINAKIFYKNPNDIVEKILRQVKLLEFGEVIHE